MDVLTAKNSQLLADKEVGNWIKENGGNPNGNPNGNEDNGNANNDITAMVQKYITEVEELRAKLLESEQVSSVFLDKSPPLDVASFGIS